MGRKKKVVYVTYEGYRYELNDICDLLGIKAINYRTWANKRVREYESREYLGLDIKELDITVDTYLKKHKEFHEGRKTKLKGKVYNSVKEAVETLDKESAKDKKKLQQIYNWDVNRNKNKNRLLNLDEYLAEKYVDGDITKEERAEKKVRQYTKRSFSIYGVRYQSAKKYFIELLNDEKEGTKLYNRYVTYMNKPKNRDKYVKYYLDSKELVGGDKALAYEYTYDYATGKKYKVRNKEIEEHKLVADSVKDFLKGIEIKNIENIKSKLLDSNYIVVNKCLYANSSQYLEKVCKGKKGEELAKLKYQFYEAFYKNTSYIKNNITTYVDYKKITTKFNIKMYGANTIKGKLNLIDGDKFVKNKIYQGYLAYKKGVKDAKNIYEYMMVLGYKEGMELNYFIENRIFESSEEYFKVKVNNKCNVKKEYLKYKHWLSVNKLQDTNDNLLGYTVYKYKRKKVKVTKKITKESVNTPYLKEPSMIYGKHYNSVEEFLNLVVSEDKLDEVKLNYRNWVKGRKKQNKGYSVEEFSDHYLYWFDYKIEELEKGLVEKELVTI